MSKSSERDPGAPRWWLIIAMIVFPIAYFGFVVLVLDGSPGPIVVLCVSSFLLGLVFAVRRLASDETRGGGT